MNSQHDHNYYKGQLQYNNRLLSSCSIAIISDKEVDECTKTVIFKTSYTDNPRLPV